MRNQVELYEDDNLIESFHFAPIHPGSLSEDDYNHIEKEVAEYCESDKLDFWENNIHMTINGKEYEKNPRPVEPDEPDDFGIMLNLFGISIKDGKVTQDPNWFDKNRANTSR